MNDMIISILAAAVLSVMIFSPETASAELMVINNPGIPGSELNLNASYSTGNNLTFSGGSSFGLSTGDIFGLADFPPMQVNILRTVERDRPYRDMLNLI